ncbi:MAG: DUF5615 family PIN-like protein [Hyphomicrobiaceae bacterium]|nr:DUF5615 family PIN-like protein [Hyphomicrobiaceae bacterium]
MRILLDACVPKRLARELAGHEVFTAHDMGWGDLDDGPLLDVMAEEFDIFLTVDKGIPAQQKLDHRSFAIIVLRAKSNRLSDLVPLVPALEVQLGSIEPGIVYEIRIEERRDD